MSNTNNFDFFEKQIDKYLKWLTESDNNRLSTITSLSYGGFYGLVKARQTPINDTIKASNKGVLSVLLALDIYLGKTEIRQSVGFNNELIYFPTDNFFNLLFLAQNQEYYSTFASRYIEYDLTIRHKRGKVIYDYAELFLALSYLTLEDLDKCKEHLARAKETKKPAGMLKGYHEMIEGILEKNIDKIKLGIETHLKWFNRDRESRDSVGFPYNLSVMGFINFARYKGIIINYESPNIYPDLIKELPFGFEFEGIPEVYEAINKSENKNKGIFGKLKNIFG